MEKNNFTNHFSNDIEIREQPPHAADLLNMNSTNWKFKNINFLLRLSIILFFFASDFVHSYEYDLCVCTLFRNEAPYLKEWIEFHKLVGVQKFYLINHFSTDNFEEVLEPYIANGEVELSYCFDPNFNFLVTQTTEYEIIRKKCEGNTKWLAILDVDEFLFPVKKGKNLLDFLKDYEEPWISSVYVFWQCYGTSFVEEIPHNKLMIEMLTLKAKKNYEHNKYGKSVIRPERSAHAGIHYSNPKLGFNSVLPNKKIITPSQMSTWGGVMKLDVDISKVRINHYWTRDEKFFREQKIPRYEKWGSPNEGLTRYPFLNKEYDGSILKYVEELRPKVLEN